MPEFQFASTLYGIVSQTRNSCRVFLVKRRTDNAIGIGLFSEELLAERARDEWGANGKIIELNNTDVLRTFVRDFIGNGEVTHVAVDNENQPGARCAWVELGELGL